MRIIKSKDFVVKGLGEVKSGEEVVSWDRHQVLKSELIRALNSRWLNEFVIMSFQAHWFY